MKYLPQRVMRFILVMHPASTGTYVNCRPTSNILLRAKLANSKVFALEPTLSLQIARHAVCTVVHSKLEDRHMPHRFSSSICAGDVGKQIPFTSQSFLLLLWIALNLEAMINTEIFAFPEERLHFFKDQAVLITIFSNGFTVR